MKEQTNKNKVKSNLLRLFMVILTFATFVHGCSKVEVNFWGSENEKEDENMRTTEKIENGPVLGTSIPF